jgi:acetyl-CoA C-acetyltransferase
MVAKDGVNLGACVILMSEEKALSLGISRDTFIYPVAGSEAADKTIPFRANLAKSAAMEAAYEGVFNMAGLDISDISCMDLYSCFPIAVFAACEALGIKPDDPRGLTVTGGLPFFGGPGNGYPMHAIVNIVERLRKDGSGYGLVGANGGFLSKHATGIYGTQAPEKGFRLADAAAMDAKVQAQKSPVVAEYADGRAVIESYSVEFGSKGPKRGFILGRLEDGRRFLGSTDRADEETIQELLSADALGREIFVTSKGPGNRFTFSEEKTTSFIPPLPKSLEGDFEHVLVKRDGNVLEVTINRPESRNSLTPDANYELEHIFNLYEADRTLWAAIITGAGVKAFCAGNDLKYSATGKQIWVPETGFGGLTSRKKRLKPVIAAVNGFAYGGGLEIAMACDMIIADEAAKFALPEVKTGLIAAAGGVFRLPKAIPHHIAREMILTGRAMGTDEAQRYGLINYIATSGRVMEKARELALEICSASPTAVSASLLMMYEGADIADPVDAASAQSDAILKFAISQDLQAGLMAFLTKQKPKWENR